MSGHVALPGSHRDDDCHGTGPVQTVAADDQGSAPVARIVLDGDSEFGEPDIPTSRTYAHSGSSPLPSALVSAFPLARVVGPGFRVLPEAFDALLALAPEDVAPVGVDRVLDYARHRPVRGGRDRFRLGSCPLTDAHRRCSSRSSTPNCRRSACLQAPARAGPARLHGAKGLRWAASAVPSSGKCRRSTSARVFSLTHRRPISVYTSGR